MDDMESSEPIPSAVERFYDGTLERIRKFMLALAVIGLAACAILFRWPVTLGFLAGATLSYLNHRWMEGAVEALGERITGGSNRERGGGIVLRAGLRYVFIALGAYGIFKLSLAGLYGFLGGVCLPIAAIACEVAVELFAALRRGF